ncbi:hypothetical protein BsWGS_24776 [Bradybaena similaris]
MEVDFESKCVQVPKNIAVLLNDGMCNEWVQALISVKNDVIGSNREKILTIQRGLVPRLLRWVSDESVSADLRTESAIILGSLSKGTPEIIRSLINEKTVPVLLKSMTDLNLRYTEAILRCLRSIFLVTTESVECLYEFSATYIPRLLSLIPCSVVCQECITIIIEKACLRRDHQMFLLESNTLSVLSPLLTSEFYKVQMPTLRCFANMCYKNPTVCAAVAAEPNLIQVFVDLMGRDKPSEMQMAAAKVLTYLHRGGAIPASDPIISRKTLGTLARMCKRDRPLEENVKGAETLAYLVEADPDLQAIASITDHLISVLANYLTYKDVKKVSSCDQKEVDWCCEMKRAAYLAFASVCANDEEIRDKVIKKEGLVEQILTSMNSLNEGEVAASLRCLQSLTRSVQQIRTVLNDNAVWKPLIQMVQSNNLEIMVLAMTCLCNLALDFSPSKDALLQNNAVEFLSQCSNSADNTVRLNAVWAIMSLTYCSSEPLRVRIISSLGTDTLLRIIEDPIMLIRQKALCIVRNILTSLHDCEERDVVLQRVLRERCSSDRTVIDRMVKLLGSEVIEAVFRTVRDSTLPISVLEQALCILSNMADGPCCKEHIIGKTEELQSVIKYLEKETYPDYQPVTCLQLPVLQFITNIIDISEDESSCVLRAAASQRLMILKNLGVQRILEEVSYKKDLQKSVNDVLKLFIQPYLS